MAKFYICRHCGNQVEMISSSGVPVMCCGRKMELLEPNTVEASGEKHLPAVNLRDDIVEVNVGSVDHPMVDEHYIEWVALETDKGVFRKHLHPGQPPHVSFALGGDKAVAVYAYCNLHGLWKTVLK